jgi:hypothetical protein
LDKNTGLMLPPEGVMSVAEKKENTITKTGNHHRTEWNFEIAEQWETNPCFQ